MTQAIRMYQQYIPEKTSAKVFGLQYSDLCINSWSSWLRMNSLDDVFRLIWIIYLLRYKNLAYEMKQHIYYSNKVTSPSNTYTFIHFRCDIVIVSIFTPNFPENKNI